jgi:hypothetical protein
MSEAQKGSRAKNLDLSTIVEAQSEDQDVIPTFVSLEGRLTPEFTGQVIRELYEQGFHFLICSRIWTAMIEQHNHVRPFHGGIIKVLHTEEFD